MSTSRGYQSINISVREKSTSSREEPTEEIKPSSVQTESISRSINKSINKRPRATKMLSKLLSHCGSTSSGNNVLHLTEWHFAGQTVAIIIKLSGKWAMPLQSIGWVLISLCRRPLSQRPQSLWVRRMASVTPDLPFQQPSVTVPWPVPNYTAWWQRHMGVHNLPRVVNS